MIKLVRLHATLLTLMVSATANASLRQYQASTVFDETRPKLCIDNNDAVEVLCQSPVTEREPVFHSSPILPGSIQLDIRPASCQSFFDDYLHTRRGLRIESALATSAVYAEYSDTAFNFPVVDFYLNGHIRVVKTRDLSADSFNNMEKSEQLFDQIIADATAVNERLLQKLEADIQITSSANGISTTIGKQDVQTVTLDIVVQTGIASQSQIAQIEKAKQKLLDRWGFKLQVIEIP